MCILILGDHFLLSSLSLLSSFFSSASFKVDGRCPTTKRWVGIQKLLNGKVLLLKAMSSPTENQVKHFSLIPLNTAKTLEGLTGAFSESVCWFIFKVFYGSFSCLFLKWQPVLSRRFSDDTVYINIPLFSNRNDRTCTIQTFANLFLCREVKINTSRPRTTSPRQKIKSLWRKVILSTWSLARSTTRNGSMATSPEVKPSGWFHHVLYTRNWMKITWMKARNCLLGEEGLKSYLETDLL